MGCLALPVWLGLIWVCFAASDYHCYLKLVYFDWETITDLEKKHKWLRLGCLSANLAIEQVLVSNLRIYGILTQECSMTDWTQIVWFSFMPAISVVNWAM